METLKVLMERRSIRKYTDEPVNNEDLEKILAAGTMAPSSMGKQSAVILVIEDKSLMAELEKINAAAMGTPDGKPFYGAPLLITVLADPSRSRATVEDGALVLGNMMNAAYDLGYGTCWIHRAEEEFKSEFGKSVLKKAGLSEDLVGIGNMVIGRPAEEPKARPRKENYIVRL